MKFSKALLVFLFFLFLINIAKAQYYAYPGECIQIQSNAPLICIPANASANETFNFTFQFTFEVPERVEYRGFVKYQNITQNITIEKPIPYIPEEINQTIESLNKSLEEKEEIIANQSLIINELNSTIEKIKLEYEKRIFLYLPFFLGAITAILIILLKPFLKDIFKKIKKGEKNEKS
jgi:hypothetical protein